MAIKKKESEKRKAGIADFRTLIEPIITEKSSIVGGDGSTVCFRVLPTASKDQVRDAVESIFDVEVRSVRTINYQGKLKRTARSVGRRAKSKKAYVKLAPGQSINIVEGL